MMRSLFPYAVLELFGDVATKAVAIGVEMLAVYQVAPPLDVSALRAVSAVVNLASMALPTMAWSMTVFLTALKSVTFIVEMVLAMKSLTALMASPVTSPVDGKPLAVKAALPLV